MGKGCLQVKSVLCKLSPTSVGSKEQRANQRACMETGSNLGEEERNFY